MERKENKEIIKSLVSSFYKDASERDRIGGNPKQERDLIRNSGLLKVLIPEMDGGHGGTWTDVVNITREFAKVDSSLAHVFAYHFVNLTTVAFWGNEEQKRRYYRETAEKELFWGNAFNPVNIQLQATKNGPEFILNGVKTFCTGSEGSDYLSVSAKKAESDDLLIAVIPTEREGIIVNGDWDSMGQRLTASGSVIFNNVYVKEHEVLNHNNRNETSAFSKIRYGISYFILNHVLLGIIEGAFEEAKIYTKKKTRPYSEYVEEAVENPMNLRHYGEFYVQFWRNMRTMSLHVPVDTIIQQLGDWVLDDKI